MTDDPRIFTITMADIRRCPKHSIHPEHYNDDGSCRCIVTERVRRDRAIVAMVDRAIQDASSARPEKGHAIPSGMPSQADSSRPVGPWPGGRRPKLSDPMQNMLMRCGREALRLSRDGWVQVSGNTATALADRKLIELRLRYTGWQARITDLGLTWLNEEGITCR